MDKLDKLVGYLTLQEAIPSKRKGKGGPPDTVDNDAGDIVSKVEKLKKKAKDNSKADEDKSIGVPEEAKLGGREPVHPFKGGSSIGRARADLLDQYEREEIDDPRARLVLIDKLIDDLLANWTSNEATMQHGELFKFGMDHGHSDRSNMLGQIRKIDEMKKKKIDAEMMKAQEAEAAALKQKEDEELKNMPFKKKK